MKEKIILILLTLFVFMCVRIVRLEMQVNSLTDERDKYKSNTETLLADCREFQIRDSLHAARVGSLELTLKEFEQYRASDAALIKELTEKNRDLQQINSAQAQTIIRLQDIPRDTVILVDSIPISAKAVHCGDAWYDFDGLMTADNFTGTLKNREALVLTESVKYKRFLFWKTRKIKDRRLDAVSLNPHTTITGLEHIIIDK